MNTRINYMYRDASNYKAHGEEIIKGVVKNSDLKDIEYFIPCEAGLSRLQQRLTFYNGGNLTNDDHVFHELGECEPTEEEPTIGLTAEEFIERFNNAPCDDLAEMKRLGFLQTN